MSDPQSARPRRSTLRRFVAWSIVAHIGAGICWGLPALVLREAEEELRLEEEARAKNLANETVKAKEFARQQEIEQTKREIEQALKKEFEKLTAALSEAKREELWKEVAKRIEKESADLAKALERPATPEQDLRTLEAELQRAMIENLEAAITEESARELADRFVDQVESQVAPGLAEQMKQETDRRVAEQMRREAEQLVAKQREAAQRAAAQATNALNEAAAKLAAAEDAAAKAGEQLAKADATAKDAAKAKDAADQGAAAAKTAAATAEAAAKDAAAKADGAAKDAAAAKEAAAKGDAAAKTAAADKAAAAKDANAAKDAAARAAKDAAAKLAAQTAASDAAAKTAAQQGKAAQDAAGKQLEQAAARLGEADAKSNEAGAKSAELDGAARTQVAAADDAIAKARTATAKATEAAKSGSADATAKAEEAKTATAAARAATKSALEAVSGQADRAKVASTAIRAAAESALSAQVEKELAEELNSTTLPRLAGKLQESFAKQLEANGMKDDALAAQVGKEVKERLAKAVPAMAKAGNAAVDSRFSDLGQASDQAAGEAGDKQRGDSLLDKALAEGLAAMGEAAAKRVGEVTANASKDASLVERAVKGMNDAASAAAKDAANSDGSDAAAKAAAAAGDAAAMAGLRDSVGALARAASNGRLGASTALNADLAAVRANSGLARGRGARRDEAQYEEVTGQIAGRDRVQGERWTTRGASGPAAQAEATKGDRPARVVGRALAEGKPALANDRAFVPTFKSIAFATVPYFGAGFRIDGKLEKWDAMPALELKTEHGRDRSRQVVKVAWSNAGLFVFTRVTDPNRRIDKAEAQNFWESDSLELWIDAYNTKEKFRAKAIGQQFWVWPFGSASNPALAGGEAVVAVKKGAHRYVPLGPDRLERWAQQTPEGWVMEARVPPALITNADLAAGRIIGFNVYINTMGGTDWYWSSGDSVTTSMQPDTWGDLLLAGSDARLEVVAPGGRDGTKTVLAVGEPLRLRVHDDDMDLDPEARDKVMVTLSGGRGGRQNAVLEETGASSGVFEGAVSSALALDEAVPAVLCVYEGERVSVTYVDQARANGAREARLTHTVAFGAALQAPGTLAGEPGRPVVAK